MYKIKSCFVLLLTIFDIVHVIEMNGDLNNGITHFRYACRCYFCIFGIDPFIQFLGTHDERVQIELRNLQNIFVGELLPNTFILLYL